MRSSAEPRTSKYIKCYGPLSFARNLSKKDGRKLFETVTKTGLNTAKTV